MADSHKGEKGQYRCFGYAAVGHQAGAGSDGTFLSDIVLQVLSFVAVSERSNIRQRQREGIEAAKLRGVRFGRPSKPLPENFRQVYDRWIAGEISGREAALQCQMPMTSFYRKAGCLRKKQDGDGNT